MNIDLRTLSIVLGITNLLQVAALSIQYKISKSRIGLGWWTLGITALALGFIFNNLRDIPSLNVVSIIGNNLLFITGMDLLFIGVKRFLDRKERLGELIATWLVFSSLILYFLFVVDNMSARSGILSFAIAGTSFFSVHALLAYKTRSIDTTAIFLALVFLANGIFFLFRALFAFNGTALGNAFSPTMIQIATYLVSLSTTILWTFGFVVMVNQRLNTENYEAKENLQLIFNTGPSAVLITRLADGLLVAINDRFTVLTGFTRDDVLGKTTPDINIWVYPEDRKKLVDILKEKGFCEAMEFVLRCKDGRLIIGEMSAAITRLQGVPHIISVTQDISERKRIEAALKESEEKFRFMTENTGDVIWHMDSNYCFDYISPADEKMRGFKREEVLGKEVWSILKPEGIELIKRVNTQRLADEQKGIRTGTIKYEFEQICKDGSWIWTEVNVSAHHDQDGKIIGYHGVSRDITERKRFESALKESEEKYRFMTENSGDVIWHLDSNLVIDYISPADEIMRGFKRDEVIGQPVWKILKPEGIEFVKRINAQRLADEKKGEITGTIQYEIEQLCKDGSWIWTEVHATPHRDQNGEIIGYHGVTRDITARKHMQEVLQQRATTDDLTGVFNRRQFIEVAQSELKRSRRNKHPMASVIFDIDNLKLVNDTYGHATGDQVLVTFSKTCMKNIRETDVFARFGGDEFVLLLPDTNFNDAYKVVERIRQALAALSIDANGDSISITVSSGMACFSENDESIDTLLGRTDMALYRAKAAGRNCIIVDQSPG